MKKLTTEEFIIRSKSVHSNLYDYSLTKYINKRTKVIIICPIHGKFEVLPQVHLKGCKCRFCVGNNFKMNNDVFIKKSKEIHGNSYDYSLVEYINNYTKVKIICPLHGVFEQTPNSHLSNKNGCSKCGGTKKLTNNEFIEISNKIHNNFFDYSLTNYINNKTKVEIICPIHGVFKQKPINHTSLRQACPKCGGTEKLTNEKFIELSNKIHNNKYDYINVDYINNTKKVKIICPIHGVFEQTPNSHLRGSGCPICKTSKGELEIQRILYNKNIKYITQYTFDNCKNKRKLPFDFYLPDYNMCIEFDGKQHYETIKYWGGEETLIKTKNNDKIKTNYCKNNNIKLIRIKYNECIDDILIF